MIIYYFNDFDTVDDNAISQMMTWLPEQQRDIIDGMKKLPRKREQAMSYAMLAYAIEHNKEEIASDETIIREFPFSLLHAPLSVLPSPFHFGEHGKPYLTNYEGIHFNISHCQQAIATAVSNREIGIDVEGRRRFSDSILQRAYNDDEQASVLAATDPEADFARIWTRKEAWFKYTGTGILMEHLKVTESEANAAHCAITTQLITPTPRHETFYLSIATTQV